MKILKRASFPCLLPIEEKTGIAHVLNDGFVVLDIETSGLDPCIHEITKVSAIHVANFRIVDQFKTLVHIRRPMESKIEKLTGISNGMLEQAPGIREVLLQLTQWYPLDPVVFLNRDFVSSFLYPALFKTGTPFDDQRPQIDLLYLASRLYPAHFIGRKPTLDSITEPLLGKIADYYEDDTVLFAELFIFFLRKLWNEFGCHTVNDLFKLYPCGDEDTI